MNNKPVAWTDGRGNYFDKNSFFPVDDLIPLYIHPAKTLTDEEIAKIVKDNDFYWDEYGGFVDSKELLKVAREILKKAQEK